MAGLEESSIKALQSHKSSEKETFIELCDYYSTLESSESTAGFKSGDRADQGKSSTLLFFQVCAGQFGCVDSSVVLYELFIFGDVGYFCFF